MGSGHRPRRPLPPPGGGREDCWSEGETGALIDAWGDRYLELSRGNLRQKDWSDVAAAVNARLAALGRPRKTDVQCKNRVDTIKKKYKLEKSRPEPSLWPFFARLDLLILPSSSSSSAPKKPPPALPPQRRPFSVPTPAIYSGGSSSRSRLNSPLPSESSEDNIDDDDVDGVRDGMYADVAPGGKRGRRGVEGVFGELAKAVLSLADIYEKVESSKHHQMVEMERQRMEFAKELEIRRMHMFMEVQLEFEKMKRPKYASGSGKRS